MPPKKKTGVCVDTATLCFDDCKLKRQHNDAMVQCHICQVWAHYPCIEEDADDILGAWCCNKCRKLPQTVAELCGKVTDLQHHIHELLRIVCMTSNIDNKLRDVCSKSISATNQKADGNTTSDVSSLTITDADQPKHETGKVPVNVPNETPIDTSNNVVCVFRYLIGDSPKEDPGKVKQDTTANKPCTSKPEDKDATNKIETKTDKQHRYIPKRNHDIYMYVPSTLISVGAVRSYLRDVGVEDIIRVSKISKRGRDSEFRIIISDTVISHTVYGSKRFRHDAMVYPFRTYRYNERRSSEREKTHDQSNNIHTNTRVLKLGNPPVETSRAPRLKYTKLPNRYDRVHQPPANDTASNTCAMLNNNETPQENQYNYETSELPDAHHRPPTQSQIDAHDHVPVIRSTDVPLNVCNSRYQSALPHVHAPMQTVYPASQYIPSYDALHHNRTNPASYPDIAVPYTTNVKRPVPLATWAPQKIFHPQPAYGSYNNESTSVNHICIPPTAPMIPSGTPAYRPTDPTPMVTPYQVDQHGNTRQF